MMTFKPLFKICVNNVTYKVIDFTIENVLIAKNETEILVSYFCNKNNKKISIEVSHHFDTLHTHTYYKINSLIDLSSKSNKN